MSYSVLNLLWVMTVFFATADASSVHAFRPRISFCWMSHPRNLELISQSSNRCDFRYETLEAAVNACEPRKSCGGITRDSGLRCGPLGMRMPYEIRSGDTLPGLRPPASWLILRRTAPNNSSCTIQPTDSRPNESPREKWLRNKGSQLQLLSTDSTPSTMVNVSLLVAGTLRGYLHCSKSIIRALVRPNMPIISLTVATYTKNDCGGSSGHGLGLHARPTDSRTIRAAFTHRDLFVRVYEESTAKIDHFFHMYQQYPHLNIFSRAVSRGSSVRYQSQFHLRQLAWKLSQSKHSQVAVLLRPDAYMYADWKIRGDIKKGTLIVLITLRDASTCQVKLGLNSILLPYSDIHHGSWDDTFALGFESSIHKYVSLYDKLLSHEYSGPFPHPEALLEHHLMKQGLKLTDACGASRGDVLELVKHCKDPA